MGGSPEQKTLVPGEINVMLSTIRNLLRREEGATAIEYTLIAALIAVAAIVAMRSVGTNINTMLSNVANQLS
jgi:pilus assembly protein Flp/PilA